MTAAEPSGGAEALLEEARAALRQLQARLSSADAHERDAWLHTSAQTGRDLAAFNAAVSRVGARIGLPSAQDRVLAYLQLRLGEIVDKDELSGVAAIHEWPRRVRELRVEQGWRIESDKTRDDLSPGQYRLVSNEPDEELAADWRTANEVRRSGGGAKGRLIEYLRRIFPRAADKERLVYVAKIQEWPRRMRELAEEGWQVVSNIDDASLVPGAYRLADLEQLPPLARESIKLRYEILDRDDFTCGDCGRSPRRGDQVVLQIHHVLFVSQGGTNDPENLLTVCSECHAGRHSNPSQPTSDELLPAPPGALHD